MKLEHVVDLDNKRQKEITENNQKTFISNKINYKTASHWGIFSKKALNFESILYILKDKHSWINFPIM